MKPVVTYDAGIAKIVRLNRETKVSVVMTAGIVLSGENDRPTNSEALALAAGYEAMVDENKALREELAAARAGKVGKEYAEAMQVVRKVMSHLHQSAEVFLAVYDKGDAPNTDVDNTLREKLADVEQWLVIDSSAATARAALLKGGA